MIMMMIMMMMNMVAMKMRDSWMNTSPSCALGFFRSNFVVGQLRLQEPSLIFHKLFLWPLCLFLLVSKFRLKAI